MADLNDITTAALRDLIGTRCNGAAGVAEGTNAGTIKTTNAVTFSIDGKAYSKAATDNIAWGTGHAVQAASTTRFYAICISAAGTVSSVQGDAGGVLPDKAANTCLLGFVKVVTGASAFTPGTTDLSAANITGTYLDVSVMPLATSF